MGLTPCLFEAGGNGAAANASDFSRSIIADAPPQAAEVPHAAKVNKSTEVAKPKLSLQDSELNRQNPRKVGSNPYDTGTFNRPNVWSNAGGRKNN